MIYLITQLAGFLLLALASAALVGWAYASHRAAPARARQRAEREALVRDLRALATGDGPVVTGADPELASLRSRLAIESARAAEAERHLEAARGRAEEATGRIAEFQRALDARTPVAEIVPDDALEVEATPVESNETALQAWRLRYFEQRVRYLEGASAPVEAEPEAVAPVDATPVEWRARVAEARATHLEDELRDAERAARSTPPPVEAPPEPEISAFAADPETDALLRWRMLYLERRVAHLQGETARLAEAVAEPVPEPVQPLAGPDPELWKWRSRYLEARLRYLEGKAAPAIEPVAELPPEAPAEEPVVEEIVAAEPEPPPAPEPLVPAGAEERPATLPGARGGAPDDLTLIDGVSPMQQTTLYSLGVFHFDQVAAWSPANVAWVDKYLRLRGRIVEEEWVEQADDLAREGVLVARRVLEDEDA
jgi:predicted flap endonuclease-1-like 5' DNA nuclease